jgi:glutamate-5-semialdehyde dehydrogenase
MTTIASQMMEMGRQARQASALLSRTSTDVRNRALAAMADALVRNADRLIRANEKDLAHARDRGLSPAMIDRLTLTEKTVAGIAKGLLEVAALPDPPRGRRHHL